MSAAIASAGAPLVGAPGRAKRLSLRALSRLGSGLLVIWVAATLTFFAMRVMAPGDPVAQVLGPTAIPTPEQHAQIMAQYGFDQPMIVQYLRYLGGLVTGDLGTSYLYKQPVVDVLAGYLPNTLSLTFSALLLAWAIALVWTMLTTGRGRTVSAVGSGGEILAISIPQLWLSIVLLVVFALGLGWFPVAGDEGLPSLVLPAVALAVPLAGYFGQVTREAVDSALEQPFVLSSRARGTSDLRVRFVHILRHAAIPAVTVSGFALGWLLSGAVIVESVFGRQGLGSALLAAVTGQDVPLAAAIVLISAALYVIANTIVDLLYPVLDPRIRP